MSGRTDVADGIVARRRNGLLTWALVACIGVAAAASASDGDPLWAGLGVAAIAVTLVPAVAYRRWTATLPWEVSLFVAVPYALQSFDPILPRSVATFLVVPALALAVAVEFDAFTRVEMSAEFAVAFVVTATMAVAGAWAVVQWVADVMLGTRALRGLYYVMWSLAAATAVGVVAGVAFAAYFRRVDRERLGFWTAEAGERSADDPVRERARSESARSPDPRQRRVVRAFQVALVAVLLAGLYERSVATVVNASIALAVMELPGLLERDLELPIDLRLTLWMVVPVFLHAIGSLGLYGAVALWDNLTHALSSSLVAAAGYATVRAFDVHDPDVFFPRKFVAAFILIFTMAFGVLWELLEFGLDGLSSWTGAASVLAQHGLANTMTDLVFDCVGAAVVAVWGGAYLAGVSRSLAERLGTEKRESD